ncbi:unnamed protein product [Acanthosepion pharaonis]|uniref:Uncharacterized protein n=1 Tax=Acanthosepion pharaonis TaxID=158019 RepID=A0A812DGD2_ACAPH|nr:unnamed protein product [Sepia pharaonis]
MAQLSLFPSYTNAAATALILQSRSCPWFPLIRTQQPLHSTHIVAAVPAAAALNPHRRSCPWSPNTNAAAAALIPQSRSCPWYPLTRTQQSLHSTHIVAAVPCSPLTRTQQPLHSSHRVAAVPGSSLHERSSGCTHPTESQLSLVPPPDTNATVAALIPQKSQLYLVPPYTNAAAAALNPHSRSCPWSPSHERSSRCTHPTESQLYLVPPHTNAAAAALNPHSRSCPWFPLTRTQQPLHSSHIVAASQLSLVPSHERSSRCTHPTESQLYLVPPHTNAAAAALNPHSRSCPWFPLHERSSLVLCTNSSRCHIVAARTQQPLHSTHIVAAVPGSPHERSSRPALNPHSRSCTWFPPHTNAAAAALNPHSRSCPWFPSHERSSRCTSTHIVAAVPAAAALNPHSRSCTWFPNAHTNAAAAALNPHSRSCPWSPPHERSSRCTHPRVAAVPGSPPHTNAAAAALNPHSRSCPWFPLSRTQQPLHSSHIVAAVPGSPSHERSSRCTQPT